MLSKEQINKLKNDTKQAEIVVASKYYSIDEIRYLFACGLNKMGENRVQDFLYKYANLKDLDINWHFIGHLQTNKVKDMINKVEVLESLDSYHLATYIEKYRLKPLDCFLEIQLVSSKFGLKKEEVIPFLEQIKDFKMINVVGLMTILDLDLTDEEKRQKFLSLVALKDELCSLGYHIEYISAGMSNDYKIALDAGSNIIRLGRIFKGGN